MQSNAERLVNLALFLASGNRHVTAEQCRAAGLGYPEGQDDAAFGRMFERDKDALRAAGLVIQVSGEDGREAYRLDQHATFARPVELTPGEIAAVRAVGAAFADDSTFPFRDDLALALGKIGMAGDEGPVSASESAGEPDASQSDEVRALAEAVAARKAVTFNYTKSSGSAHTRKVDPYGVFFREGRWYLAGRDRDKNATRTFAISRMSELDVNPASPRTPDFERPQDFDVRDHERLPFQYGTESFVTRLRFEPEIAWRADRLARGRGTIDKLVDGSAVWTVDAANIDRLAAWIIDEGPGIHAVEPERLVDTLSSGLRTVVALHG